MTRNEIKAYCLAKPQAYEDLPFGPEPVCYKVKGKIFAQLYADKITLKCTAFSGQMLRQAYPDVVVRGYHCPPVQQPYWNTIDLSRFPGGELAFWIDHAYETVGIAAEKGADGAGKGGAFLAAVALSARLPKDHDTAFALLQRVEQNDTTAEEATEIRDFSRCFSLVVIGFQQQCTDL